MHPIVFDVHAKTEEVTPKIFHPEPLLLLILDPWKPTLFSDE